MKIYYIYHIIGKKIGCTSQPKKRIKRQGFHNYEILEQHTDIIVASDRERELQKEYGYKVDGKPYWQTLQMPTTESRKRGGKTNVESGRMSALNQRNIDSGHMSRLHQSNQIPIIQMDKLGNPIKEFPSARIAGDVLHLRRNHITQCCTGNLKTHGGFTFKHK